MILEEATYDTFNYYPSKLKPKSNNLIIAACELCGDFRVIKKSNYNFLCKSCASKGNKNHLGFKHTEETKALMSAAQTGEKNPNFCKLLTQEHKAKLRIAQKHRKIPGMLGKHHSYTAKKKIREALSGAKSYLWQGGISFEPYCVKFNNAFKEYIRAKFGFKCFLRPVTQAENGKKLCVHHVNYNKNCGCDGDKTCQFVPLCISCHSKTNNNRDYWQKIITDKLHCLIIGWDI